MACLMYHPPEAPPVRRADPTREENPKLLGLHATV